jgi:hypothetical protein
MIAICTVLCMLTQVFYRVKKVATSTIFYPAIFSHLMGSSSILNRCKYKLFDKGKRTIQIEIRLTASENCNVKGVIFDACPILKSACCTQVVISLLASNLPS